MPRPRPSPASRSTRAARTQVMAALDGHDVLVVQGAPVTDACSRRPGPAPRRAAPAAGRSTSTSPRRRRAASRSSTTPGKNAEAVAELTIAFMVMLARRLPEVMRHVEAGGEFGHDNYEGAQWFGHDLAGHTLGLVGFGHVGRRVAARALAFGMRVVVLRPVRRPGSDRGRRRGAGRPRPSCSAGRTSSRSTRGRRPTTRASSAPPSSRR